MHIGGGEGLEGYALRTPTPRQIFKKLANKNAIKPKIGGSVPAWTTPSGILETI